MTDECVRKHCTKVAGTRMKLHLSGNDPKKNVKRCEKCPLEVREEMMLLLQEAERKKKNKQTMEETIRREMRATLGPIDEEGDFNAEMERDLYKAMKRSREEDAAANWRSGLGGGSQSHRDLGRVTSTAAPFLYRSDSARQATLNPEEKTSLKRRLGKIVSRFFIHDSVPANKVKSHHFQNMMHEASEIGKGTCKIVR